MVLFDKKFFENESALDQFTTSCDVIVHLAGMNRNDNPETIYATNVSLAEKLVRSLERTGKKPHVIFSSSRQEELDNVYGNSKKEARQLLAEWAENNQAVFTGMIIPNVFGAFGKPFYNSVVATFCHLLTNGGTPKVEVDAELKLLYVAELVEECIKVIEQGTNGHSLEIKPTSSHKVSELLHLLESYTDTYLLNGNIPLIRNDFERNLFNTYRSYINIRDRYPVKFVKHTDARGSFSEIIRLNTGGQVSFSTTLPGITRGNHFHTRKIERFAVIKGEALIQLRRTGTEEVINIKLTGEDPSYVDMPIWYAHNITNIGTEELYTIFWISEFYNSDDPDTFIETV